MLDEAENPVASVLVCDFPDREAIDAGSKPIPIGSRASGTGSRSRGSALPWNGTPHGPDDQSRPARMLMVRARITVLNVKATRLCTVPIRRMRFDVNSTSAVCDATPITTAKWMKSQ